ncbi:histone H3-like centromeric protein A [Stomoxys calcitrans]|uniref:histone H3-like centromeric protein A n=1 Tax=Stomoxys calcitrans TaxID=35570 RepID=UPI0027E2C593|nr:histone H3-like centromeric protein A [Stomoxys calcitrans]
MSPRKLSSTKRSAAIRRVGTLGDASVSESNISSPLELSPIQNPYEILPTTSRAARARGELQFTLTNSTNRKERNTTSTPKSPVKGAARRKRKTPYQLQKANLREIRKLQSSVDHQIPRVAFARVVREITMDFTTNVTHYTAVALQALQEATEMFLTQVFQDAYMLTMHRRAVTLSVSDMTLIRALKLQL